MAEDEDVNIIVRAEKEKREIGIAEQNPHNRKKEKKDPAFYNRTSYEKCK
jgi:hypothetical protein